MIGIIGGTGQEGRGLGLRLAMAGKRVVLGSRDPARGRAAADDVLSRVPGLPVTGGSNGDAAESDIVLVCVPYEGQRETLTYLEHRLAGKLVVTTVVPISFEKGGVRALGVPEGSAAMQAQAILPKSRVASAFHTISSSELIKPDASIDGDVVVFADNQGDRKQVMALAEKVQGVRAVDGGGLAYAVHMEGLVALLIGINRRYKAHTGIRVTGI
ncbi:MAG: NADPH-dependent F420 reductase [SAR202 cluster bacterium]|nr:NADPH-dependent F420 reductase [SAR202 cluster bacterium]